MSGDRLRTLVRDVVNDLDPERLIAMGAPEDEYRSEVHDLVELITAGGPVTVAAVGAIWAGWFSLNAADLRDRAVVLSELTERLRTLAPPR